MPATRPSEPLEQARALKLPGCSGIASSQLTTDGTDHTDNTHNNQRHAATRLLCIRPIRAIRGQTGLVYLIATVPHPLLRGFARTN